MEIIMTKEEIVEDIIVILEGNMQKLTDASNRKFLIPPPDNAVNLLYALSQRLAKDEKEYFWQILSAPFEKEIRIIPMLKLTIQQKATLRIFNNMGRIFELLIKTDRIDTALTYFKIERNINHKLYSILKSIKNLLDNEPGRFNREILTLLEKYMSALIGQINREHAYEKDVREDKKALTINGRFSSKPILPMKARENYVKADYREMNECTQLVKDIIAKIKLTKYAILETEYEGVNLEINQDKDELKKRVLAYDFNPKVNTCLDRFDENFQSADELGFKSCIGHMRTFLEIFLEDVAKKVELVTGNKSKAPLDHFVHARGFLYKNDVDFLSKTQHDLLEKFYAFCSDKEKGAHAIGSDRLHARLVRNMTIEIGLFLFSRLDTYIKESNDKGRR